MSKLIAPELIAEKATIVDAPHVPTTVDRTFELPTALYGTTVACYLGFIALMAGAFGAPALIIPMVIFAFIIVAGFGVPAIWATMQGTGAKPAMGAGQFANRGIMTHTGRLKPRDAAAQVLVLPVLVFLWGLAVVTIAATI
ncbi:hypothetical protein [Altererythrobacter litoralis]|uniref:Uncharacterized protein n=1 Tax=Altererythrobacter litoralis TaxID=3113904 RepID=A0ABU7GFB2_9SPHN|nr:hypothetical protein [Erythrobacteraceae bacterium 1XM1-14]